MGRYYQRYLKLKKEERQHHVVDVNVKQQMMQIPFEQDYDYESCAAPAAALVLVCAPSYNNNNNNKRSISSSSSRPKLLSLLFLSVLSCSFILVPHLLSSFSSTFSFLCKLAFVLFCFLCFCCFLMFVVFLFKAFTDSVGEEDEGLVADVNSPMCSSISNGTICCDRSSIRSDTCIMKGDVRTNSASSSIILYRNTNGFIKSMVEEELQHEKIRPYTRKWETSVMDTIDELDLVLKKEMAATNHDCDVTHDVPAVFFSTGGYTGNFYHEFNDGILPLYITSQHLKKKVVFVILEYHNWWVMKYGDVISRLSDYPVIDFSGDKRSHCFPEAIVGLRIHDELTVDPSLMRGNKTIVEFRNILDQAYSPRIRGLIRDEAQENLRIGKEDQLKKAKLVILSRNGSRAITNEDLMVKMAEEIGFRVEVVRPKRTTELAKIYWALNSSDVMVGVHGAAMTHFLFMKPGSVFIQIIPLGTDWAAETYYGEPARKLGLKYIGYSILPKESSLYDQYDKDDPVLRDPSSVNKKGWQYTKTIYLHGQNVRLNLTRFRKRLVRAYDYSVSRINKQFHHQSQ